MHEHVVTFVDEAIDDDVPTHETNISKS